MFTGLVREIGHIRTARQNGGGVSLAVEAAALAHVLAIGDSVAVNGVCLTVTAVRGPRFHFDLSPETLRTTTARGWRSGDGVHLEPSLRASDPIGGHFVLGHVDDVGRVMSVRSLGSSRQVEIGAPEHVLTQLLPKGSIAVDGVSLTLDAGPFARSFTITLIPETLRVTRFASIRVNDLVNLEVDVLAKAGRLAAGRDAPGNGPRQQHGHAPLTLQDVLSRGWQ